MQQRFVDHYLASPNASQAAVRAGYAKADVKVIASRNLTLSNVAHAIEVGRRLQTGRRQADADWVLDALMDTYALATADKQHSAAIRAVELLGRNLGILVERKQLVVESASHFVDWTTDQLREHVALQREARALESIDVVDAEVRELPAGRED